MNSTRPPLRFYLILLLASSWVVFSTVFWDYQSRRLDGALAPPAPDISVPNAGRRLWLDNDSAYWLIHARDMIEGGRWRIRHTRADNAPHGRPVHWSQSLTWLMLAGGSLRRLFTGQPLFAATEDAAVWINPILLLVFTGTAAHASYRRWGPVVAFFLAGTLLTQPDLEFCFQPLRPDHQSLQWVFLLGSMFWIWHGQSRRGIAQPGADLDERGGRQVAMSGAHRRKTPCVGFGQPHRAWMISGFLTGLALWVGATVTLIAWTPLLFAAMIHRIIGGGREDTAEPAGWRVWGRSAGLTALLFFFIEYFPFSGVPRWEVNHPLYALSLALWGEALSRAATAGGEDRRGRFVACALALAALLPPALPLLLPPGFHALRDPLMLRFHRDISEFAGIISLFRRESSWSVALHFGLLPIVALAEAARAFRGSGSESQSRSAAGLAAVYFGLLSVFQIRWLPYFAGASAVAGACRLARWRTATANGQRRGTFLLLPRRIAAIALLLHPLLFAAPTAVRMRQVAAGDAVRPQLVRAALFKRLAKRLRAAIRHPAPIFMTEPDMAAALYYHARLPTIASYYWENTGGLRAWSAFFADETDRDAARLAAQRGITHVMVSRGPRHAMAVQWVAQGVEDRAAAARLLAARLVGSGPPIPGWLAVNPELTAIGAAHYRLETARRAPKTWDTRFTVFDVNWEK